jgi:peroxiredoxin Q/BCP
MAPDFALPSQTGETVNLKDLLGRKEVVLYFYPKDNTSGCTAEACAFRDSYEVFKERGAEVVGVSSDSVDSHEGFASRNNLPFILLSDEGGKVRNLYGASSTFGLIPGRVTYIIDKRGVVRHIFASQLNPKKHIGEALKTLEKIQEGA